MKYIRTVILFIMSFIALMGIIWYVAFSSNMNRILPTLEKELVFRTEGKSVQHFENGKWENFEIKGVNMGTGYPGLFPNDTGISEDTYYRWFTQISEMNANTVRVYKIQSPEFYSALYKYNKENEKPLYLVQGVDFSEHVMYSEENVFKHSVQDKLFNETYDVVDAIHGKKAICDIKQGKLHLYTKDVSDYVIGYILGIEWDELFVDYTCRMNENAKIYNGKYVKNTKKANAFEIFMAKWGNQLLSYENNTWGSQKLISYCNWPLTDALYNDFETTEQDMLHGMPDREAIFDIDNIIAGESLNSGIFASYNVYPYYPYFLQCGEYTVYEDESGNRNPYRKYILELSEHHKHPLVISEYGVAASRSLVYKDVWREMSHGGLSEDEQGKAIRVLYDDIKKAECAGSIVFTWQDEWYKTAWNERALSDPDRRAFWGNAQCAEQHFGLMAFDGDKRENAFYPDGNFDEWTDVKSVSESNDMHMKMHSDEKYVYFFADGLKFNKKNDTFRIAIDTTPKSGSEKYKGCSFDRKIDFIVEIKKDKSVQLLVHDYYDSLMFSAIGIYDRKSEDIIKEINKDIGKRNITSDTQDFSIVTRAADNVEGLFGKKWDKVEVGKLIYGDANPSSKNFDSNADFNINGDAIEVRIPWQLLNFYDPSQREVIDDFRSNGYEVTGLKVRSIYAAIYCDNESECSDFGQYKLKKWNKPEFHERLKPSYYAVQDMFGKES